MPEDVKPGTGKAEGNSGAGAGAGDKPAAVTLPPGGIAGVDTESSDLDLMQRLITGKNQPVKDTDGEDGDEGEDGEGEDAGEDTGEDTGEDGDGDGDDDGGEEGSEDSVNAALEEVAKELGFDGLESLSAKQLEALKKLVKAKGEGEGESGDEDGDGDGDEDLTEYEKSLLAEDEGEKPDEKAGDKKDDKAGDKAGDKPYEEVMDETKFFSALLEGKFKPLYKNDADFYKQLNEAAEKKDVEAYEVLQNQRFVERGLKFLLPAMRLLVDKQLDTFANLITPALSEYTRSSSQRSIAAARDKAIQELESLTVKSGAKPYSGIKQFLTPESPDKKLIINGKSVPSSPWTRVLKANPEILNIRVSGKDGNIDPTATFIAQYKAAMKFGKTSSASSPVTKKVAEKLVDAGVKAGQRQTQRNAGGKLNSNSGGGTGRTRDGQKKNWAKEYAEIGNVTGAASWIGS